MDEVIGYVDTRAAEVATAAIASDVAQVHQDMLDADADASAAAASAASAAGTLANAVKKTGESSQTVEGDITMSTGDLSVAGDAGVQGQLSVLGGCDLRAPVKIPVAPTNNDDAASKKYVDDADALKISIANINQYAVGLTGNQEPIAGNKTFTGLINIEGGRFSQNLRLKNTVDNVTEIAPTSERQTAIHFMDKNNTILGSIAFNHLVTGEKQFALYIYDKNGGSHKTILATYTDS